MDIKQPGRKSRLSRYRKVWKNGYLSAPDEWDWARQVQAKFLKQQGLRPSDKFLDLGCGFLRGTIDVIDYLEDGHFFGIDISQKNIERGQERVRQLCKNKPNLALADSFEIEEVWPNMRFDFILAASLFTHMYPDDLAECLRQVYRVLDGIFFATIFKDNTVPVYQGWCGTCIDHQEDHSVSSESRQDNYENLNFAYNTSWIAQVAKDCQLQVKEIGPTEIGQFMLEITPNRVTKQ